MPTLTTLSEDEYSRLARFGSPQMAAVMDEILGRVTGGAGSADSLGMSGAAALSATIPANGTHGLAVEDVLTGSNQGLQALLANLIAYSEDLLGDTITIAITVTDLATPANQATMTGTAHPVVAGTGVAPVWSAATVSGAYTAQGTHDVLLGSSAHMVQVQAVYSHT